MFIHAFGAYFGVMVGLTMKFRNYAYSEDKQGTNSTTDVFSLLGNSIEKYNIQTHFSRIHPSVALLAKFQCSSCHG